MASYSSHSRSAVTSACSAALWLSSNDYEKTASAVISVSRRADRLKHRAHIGVLVLFLEQDVPCGIAVLSMPQSFRIMCDGVFETMKDCRAHVGSPSRCSISLMVSWNWIFGSVGAEVPDALGVDEDHMLLAVRRAATG